MRPGNGAVVIIGGGFAGLAAAVDLAERGRAPLLLERRSFLGGRAYSFTDKTTGATVDNGQHLMMGCYHHTLAFLGKIGALDRLRFQPNPQIDFLQPADGGTILRTSLKCPPLPAPLHLLAGLVKLRTIGWEDRIQALRVGLEVRRLNGDRARLADVTVREWLTRLGQSERMQRRFWDIMVLATLNESSEVASADMFARVLDQAYLHSRRDSAMVVSKVGLSELYTEAARSFIESRGGEVRLNADVVRIEFDRRRVRRVVLRNGESLETETLISAVPYFALSPLLPPEVLESEAGFRNLGRIRSAPIVSINLWYREPITELEFASLLDSRIEWVFNRSVIAPGGGRESSQHLALVISGAYEAASKPNAALVEIAVEEMQRFFPAARGQTPLHAFVMREHRATISHTVGVARLRPAQRTDFENLWLAGDWTDTGLPSTIEGAVWSGQQCAKLIV